MNALFGTKEKIYDRWVKIRKRKISENVNFRVLDLRKIGKRKTINNEKHFFQNNLLFIRKNNFSHSKEKLTINCN